MSSKVEDKVVAVLEAVESYGFEYAIRADDPIFRSKAPTMTVKQATTKILKLIQQEVVAGRIDELENLEKQEIYQINGHDIIENSSVRVVPKKYIKERIKQLKAQEKK